MDTTWTLSELTEHAADALAQDAVGQTSGRIRDVPDQRTVRYYTTLGLLDRPTGWRGRTALYGQRHLLQLVAIKRLQAQGRTLAQVQAELTGATDATLRRVARPDSRTRSAPDTAAAADRSRRTGRRFWAASATDGQEATAPPAQEVPAGAAAGGTGTPTVPPGTEQTHTEAPATSALVHGVTLTPGLTLLVSGGRPLRPDDVHHLSSAAAPLLGALRERGLIPSGPGPGGDGGDTATASTSSDQAPPSHHTHPEVEQ